MRTQKAEPPSSRSVSSASDLFSPQELVFDFQEERASAAPRRRTPVREKIRRWLAGQA